MFLTLIVSSCCLPTLAVTPRETGAIKYAAFQLAYMSALAYSVAFVVYQTLRAVGLS